MRSAVIFSPVALVANKLRSADTCSYVTPVANIFCRARRKNISASVNLCFGHFICKKNCSRRIFASVAPSAKKNLVGGLFSLCAPVAETIPSAEIHAFVKPGAKILLWVVNRAAVTSIAKKLRSAVTCFSLALVRKKFSSRTLLLPSCQSQTV